MPDKKPKILIATGIYPPDIGGPAKYAYNLRREFLGRGLEVGLICYGKIEKILPPGLRHLFFLTRLIFFVWKYDVILALDTYSVGLPSVIVGKILGKKVVFRVGGDFLWETFINRTNLCLPLPDFYKNLPQLSFKEMVIFRLTKFIARNGSKFIFTTAWQKNIWGKAYNISDDLTGVVKNFFPEAKIYPTPQRKVFVWAGRPVALKQTTLLQNVFGELQKADFPVFLELFSNLSSADLAERIQSAYALVLPSVSDVSPNFILEGLSYGKPFICTEHTGLKDDLNQCGVFINPCRQSDLLEAIKKICVEEYYKSLQGNLFNVAGQLKKTWSDVANDFIEEIKFCL